MNEIAGFLLLIGVLLYFVPLVVASNRRHRQVLAIGVLNFFLGWTLIGWVIALVWACIVSDDHAVAREPVPETVPIKPAPTQNPVTAIDQRTTTIILVTAITLMIGGLIGWMSLGQGFAFTGDPPAKPLPGYLKSESNLAAICNAATKQADQMYSGADGLASIAGEVPQAVAGAGGGVVTCQVKVADRRGWLNAIVTCEDSKAPRCVKASTVSLGGAVLKLR